MDKKINRKLLILGGLIILALALSSLAPRLLGDSLTKVNLGQALQGPSSSEWFGTDALGRSVFARAVSGGAETVLPALMILMLIAAVGSFIGGDQCLHRREIRPAHLAGYHGFSVFSIYHFGHCHRQYLRDRSPANPHRYLPDSLDQVCLPDALHDLAAEK